MDELKILQEKIIDIRNQRKIMKLQINNILPNINSYTYNDYLNIKKKEQFLKKQKYILETRLKKFKRLNEINKSNI